MLGRSEWHNSGEDRVATVLTRNYPGPGIPIADDDHGSRRTSSAPPGSARFCPSVSRAPWVAVESSLPAQRRLQAKALRFQPCGKYRMRDSPSKSATADYRPIKGLISWRSRCGTAKVTAGDPGWPADYIHALSRPAANRPTHPEPAKQRGKSGNCARPFAPVSSRIETVTEARPGIGVPARPGNGARVGNHVTTGMRRAGRNPETDRTEPPVDRDRRYQIRSASKNAPKRNAISSRFACAPVFCAPRPRVSKNSSN